MKALLYCVKSKPYLHRTSIEKWWWNDGCYEPLDYREGFITLDKKPLSLRYKDGDNDVQLSQALNGKIVAEVEIDKVDQIWYMNYEEDNRYDCLFLTEEELCLKSCLDHYKLHDYLKGNNGYALHLTNIKVFDKPKELSNYSKRLPSGDFQQLGKAPQNMMNVCEIKYLIEDYVLISIQPQHLCKILNGEKTIEIRKKVLNCLKEM